MMNQIHEYMNLPPDVKLRECGTQEYEADVVVLEQRGKTLIFNAIVLFAELICLCDWVWIEIIKCLLSWTRSKREEQAACTVRAPPQTVQ